MGIIARPEDYETATADRESRAAKKMLEWARSMDRLEADLQKDGINTVYCVGHENQRGSTTIRILERNGDYTLMKDSKAIRKGTLAECVAAGRAAGYIGKNEKVKGLRETRAAAAPKATTTYTPTRSAPPVTKPTQRQAARPTVKPISKPAPQPVTRQAPQKVKGATLRGEFDLPNGQPVIRPTVRTPMQDVFDIRW